MRKYLLVDDNRPFAENLAEILRDTGEEVTVAESGQEALGLIKAHRYDAMVTDMRMPEMGGAELVHRLRAMDPGIPVVVATAYSGDEDLRIARNEGLLAIVPKPIPLDRLIELLAGARRDGVVAVIEDDETLAENLQDALSGNGFTTITAKSVLETERLGGVQPFVGLVDLRVPGGPDGEAFQRFRGRFPRVPVLVMTGHPDVVIPSEAGTVFRKPFNSAEVMADIERLYREGSRAA